MDASKFGEADFLPTFREDELVLMYVGANQTVALEIPDADPNVYSRARYAARALS